MARRKKRAQPDKLTAGLSVKETEIRSLSPYFFDKVVKTDGI